MLYTHIDYAFNISQHPSNALPMWNVRVGHVLGKVAYGKSIIKYIIHNGMHKTPPSMGIGIWNHFVLSSIDLRNFVLLNLILDSMGVGIELVVVMS